MYNRNLNEVKILEKIKERNRSIEQAISICDSDKYVEYNIQDPETGEIKECIHTSEDFAKDYISEHLKKLTFNELFRGI